MNNRDTLIVVYDYGSLAPTRLAEAAKVHDVQLVFIVGAEAILFGFPNPVSAAHVKEIRDCCINH